MEAERGPTALLQKSASHLVSRILTWPLVCASVCLSDGEWGGGE